MDSLNPQYFETVEKVLQNYADFLAGDDQVQIELVFDRARVAFGTALLLAIFW